MPLLQDHWNRIVPRFEQPSIRNHIRASELGMPMIDRFLRMNGVPVTNPFPERVLRIFNAGNVLEWIVLRAFAMAGILNEDQRSLEIPETKNHLKITGRLDATVGGFVDWNKALMTIEGNLGRYKMDLDRDVVSARAVQIIEGLKEQYPRGWKEEMLVEIKSINSMAFWNSKKTRDEFGNFVGYDHNKLQLYAYLVATGLRQGFLFYLSKDDFTIAEVPVNLYDQKLCDAYLDDIQEITHYIRSGELPEPEEEVVWNERTKKLEVNWKVERSPYLELVYGYADGDDLSRYHHQTLLDVNRAFKHLQAGEDKVKPEDLQWIEKYEMRKYL